jgi:signal transduction histidine kinase
VRQGRLEAEKLAALDKERSARLVELGRLAAGVAHEIHNPLQGVDGYLMLLEREAQPEKRQAHIAAIRGALAKIERLTKDLLGFAQPRVEHRVALAPYDLFKTFDRSLDADPRFAGVRRVLDVESGVPSIFVEAPAIERILLNLALNACQAMDGRGTLTIAARRAGTDRVELVVGDEGPGVPKELRARLFEPFQSGRGSTGLGLWICDNLARAHGGAIRHEPGSTADAKGGSRFVVTLPAYNP